MHTAARTDWVCDRRRAGSAAGDLPHQAPLLDAEASIEALFRELNSDALRFQEAYYSERRYLSDLDQRRCAAYEEIVAQPAA